MTKKLTPLEAEKMEKARLLLELREKELLLVNSEHKALDHRQQILQLMISNLTIERHAANDKKAEVLASKERDKKVHDEFLASVRKRLKLVGKFGYNPDTLEIVEAGS